VKYFSLILFISFIMLTSFSGPQDHDIIAVDVALLLPEPINQSCTERNNAPQLFDYPKFKDGIFVPHITLFQCYIKAPDTVHLIAALQNISGYLKDNPLMLKIDSIIKKGDFYFYVFQDNTQGYERLKALQSNIHFMMQKYIAGAGFVPDSSSFADRKASKFDLEYVTSFTNSHSLDSYWPHITLGASSFAPPSGPVSIDSFKVQILGLFQLSSNGTCNKNNNYFRASIK
jgi:hypothetical protein